MSLFAFGLSRLVATATTIAGLGLLAPQYVLAQAALSPALAAELALTPEGESVEVYAVLREQASASALRKSLRQRGLSRAERSSAVLAHLRRANTAAQAELLRALRSTEGVGAVKPHWLVNVVAFAATPEALAEIAARDDVEAVNLDLPWRFEGVTAAADATAAPDRAEIGLKAVNAQAMWARGYTGFGTVALTADTGVDPFHPAIGHKYAGHDGRPAPWFASEAFPTATDCGDHGTHVNGTIMGLDRLTNDTIGVAPGAHWLGGAILCGTGTGDNLSIFEWALDPDADEVTLDDRPFAINNSWYDPSIEDVECTAANPYPQLLDNLTDAGVAVVFSAGNAGPDPSTITPPHSYNATLTNAFTVGALVGRNLAIADFSSRGPATCLSGDGTAAIDIKPEVSAPGVEVRSCLPGGGYGTKSGTSMAAPHTAGAVLLLHEAFPELDGDAILQALYYSARDLGPEGEDNTFGRGIIDVGAAYTYLVDAGNVPTAPTRPSVAADIVAARGGGRQCRGSFVLEATVMNTGTEAIESVSVGVTGFGDGGRTLDIPLAIAPGETAVLPVALEADGEGDRFLSLRVTAINGAPADPRLDLGASYALELSRATPPALVMDRAGDRLCLGSPVTLSLESDIDDPALVFFDDAPDFEVLPPAAAAAFTVDALTAPLTLYGLNEYRRSGGPRLPAGGEGLTYAEADTFAVRFRALGNGTLRRATLALERASRVQLEVIDPERDESVGRFNRRLQAGLNDVELFARLETGRTYDLLITRARGLGYDPSVALADAGVDGFVEFVSIDADDPAVRAGSFFLFDLEVGYYDGCPTTPVTLVPDSSRTASAREIGTFDDAPVVGQGFDVFDATAPEGTAYAWHLDGDAVAAARDAVATVVPRRAGEQVVRMSLLDPGGCHTAAERTVVVGEAPSSTSEALPAGEYRLWPNPTADAFSVDGDLAEVARVTILDAAGRTVARYEGGAHRYGVGHLPAGTYTVRLTGHGGASRGFVLEVQR